MKRVLAMNISVLLIIAVVTAGCNGISDTPSPVQFEFGFRDGATGGQAGFAEYSLDGDMQLEAEIRTLPPGLEVEGPGDYLQEMNRSDDLFMFLKRGVGTAEGVIVIPDQEYRIGYTIVFASNAPSGTFGIGGAPGEDVFLKAGASSVEPKVYLDSATNHYLINVNKGEGNSGSGAAASVTGHIANGLPDTGKPTYVSLVRHHLHEYTVTTSTDGGLWLLPGTDPGCRVSRASTIRA